jgi:DNA-binding transcriptional LysR family regulator
VAVRAGRLADSALVSRRVGDLQEQLFAAPAYVARRGAPRSLAEVANHDCVLFRPRNGEEVWSMTGPEGDVATRVCGRLAGDDYGFVRAAVVAGGGVALLPRIICVEDVAEGRLVRLLPAYEQRLSGLYLVHTYARHVPAKIAAFRDHIVEEYARQCVEVGGARRGSTTRRARS